MGGGGEGGEGEGGEGGWEEGGEELVRRRIHYEFRMNNRALSINRL